MAPLALGGDVVVAAELAAVGAQVLARPDVGGDPGKRSTVGVMGAFPGAMAARGRCQATHGA